jgi:hypothetical protein
MDTQLQQILEIYIEKPKEAIRNFALGVEYERRGQYAAAMSLYLRTAELTEDKDLQYESLLRNYLMISSQGGRDYSATGQLFHAIALLPTRPEAYLLFARHYQSRNLQQEAYAYACMGLEVCSEDHPQLMTNVQYPGWYSLLVEKAIAGWWIGRCDDSREIFRNVMDNFSMTSEYAELCRNNLARIGGNIFPITPYIKDQHKELVFKFKGSETVRKNHSQTYQDMFVLAALDGKTGGTYVEIGAGDPFHNNNTALLETEFGWKGASIEILQEEVDKFKAARKNSVFCQDAVATDYRDFLRKLNLGKEIDYLQLDCDPPHNTYEILLAIPFDEYKFATITYEHDYYADETKSFRDKSRKYLQEQGYELLVTNISADKNSSYEDWWVHPDLVSKETIERMRNACDRTKKAEDYMLGRL